MSIDLDRERPVTGPAEQSVRTGPSENLTVIEPSSGWAALRMGEVWRFRELAFFLTWRDVKVRYKQTVLGAAWAILQPVLAMVIFTVIFGHFAHIPSDGVPYPIFAFAALLPWTFFAYAIGQSSNSLVSNANLISKVYFPRLVVPIAATLSGLVDLLIAFGVLLCLMIYYGIRPTALVFLLPIFVFMALLAALAVGIWLSALNVQYRDVRYTVPFLTQLWLYATPVAYPAGLVTGRFHTLLALNPMTGVVNGFRWSVFGKGQVDATSIVSSIVISTLVLLSGLYYFRRVEQRFADVV
jgi:lipopolysaccharide transport system permease protein